MPVAFHERGFRFFFDADEGTPREPVHIHVEKGDKEAKFRMRPTITNRLQRWLRCMHTAVS
jgi:hypothetical protein